MCEYYYLDKDLMKEHEGYEFEDGKIELDFDLRNIIEKYQDYVYELGLDVYIDNDVKVFIYDDEDDVYVNIEDHSCSGDRIDLCLYIPTGIQEVKDCADKMMTKDSTIISEGYYGLKRFVEEEVKSQLNYYEEYWVEEAEFQNEMNKNTITLEHASARIDCDGVLVIKNNKNEVVKYFDGYKKDKYFLFDDIKIEINNLYGEISMKNYGKFFSHRHAETPFEKMNDEEFTKLKEMYDEK